MTIFDDIGEFIQDDILDPVREEVEEFVEDVGDFLTEGIFSLLGIDDLIDDIESQLEGTLVTKRGAVEPLPVVYGTRALGGTIVHMATTGTQNKNLWVVYALADADQPISSINKIYMDDVLVWDSGVIQTSKFQGYITIETTVGSHSTQPFTTLQTEDSLWTSNDLLLHTAAVAIKYTWNTDVFTGIPKVLFEVSGTTVRDIDLLPTETFGYSRNPAEVLFDYLTNSIYGKGLSIIDGEDIDLASFQDAKTYCDELITSYSGGPTHSRFTCDLVIPTSDTVMRNIELILQTCRGTLPYIDGKFHLIIEKHYTAADYGLSDYFNFNMDNILGSWGFKSGDVSSRFNRVKAIFSDIEYGYRNNFVAAESSTFRTEDGRLLEKQIALQGVTDKYRALDTANVVMRKSRQQIKVSFKATTEALQVKSGTVVTVTHPTPGWVDKQFRVISLSLLSDGNVSVSLSEHESTVYDLTVPNEIATAPDTNLPDPTSVPDVTGLAVSSLHSDWLIDDWTIIPRIHVTWTAATDPYVVGYDIEYKKSADSVWLPAGSPNSIGAIELYIENVDPDTDYDIRLRARNSANFHSSWASQTDYTTAAAPTPDAPSGLTASTTVAGEILLSWTLASGQAIRKTQIWRSSSNWANAVLVNEKSGTEAVDVIVGGASYNYWVIAINSFGVSSVRHPNDTTGVTGTALLGADITSDNVEVFAVVTYYYQTAQNSIPATPADGSGNYNFLTNTVTPPAGWGVDFPTEGKGAVWSTLTTYTALGQYSTTADNDNTFSVPSSVHDLRATKNVPDGGFQVATAHYITGRQFVASGVPSPRGPDFSADGSKMYLLSLTAETIYEYDLSTPWHIKTASLNQSQSIATYVTSPAAIKLSPDGTKLYTLGYDDNVDQFSLSTPWDISTITHVQQLDVSSLGANFVSMDVSVDGTKLYVLNGNSESPWQIYQYVMSTPWDLSTATYTSGHNFTASANPPTAARISFNQNGDTCVIGGYDIVAYQYSLSTPWDITTMAYTDNSVDLSPELGSNGIRCFSFEENGFKMYANNGVSGTLYQYELDTH